MIETTHEPKNGPQGERSGHLEEYAGGYIHAWVGHIPLWLLAVYFILFIWGLYYMVTYWGGLGPGRIG